MLSSRFIAWQMPANQTIATSVKTDGSAPSGSAPASAKTRNAPIASDATSLASGESCSRSSRMPTTNMASAAERNRQPSAGGPMRSGAQRNRRRTRRSSPRRWRSPPIVGVGDGVPAVRPRRDDSAARRREPAHQCAARQAAGRRNGEHDRQEDQHDTVSRSRHLPVRRASPTHAARTAAAGECRRRLYPGRPTRRAAAAEAGRA